MSRLIVCDHANGKGGGGLYLRKDDVVCWRHQVRAAHAGMWEIYVALSAAAMQALDWPDTTRAAVVDDFGSLVIVGEPQ